MPQRILLDDLLDKIENPDVPMSELEPYFTTKRGLLPFSPDIELNDDLVDSDQKRGQMLINIFNNRFAKRRQKIYDRKIADGWQGLKVLAEGDSWFQYPDPRTPMDDVIEHLMNDYAVYCVSAAGEELSKMVSAAGIANLKKLVQEKQSDVFLFSAGGNDIVGPELKQYVLDPQTGFEAKDYIGVKYDEFLDAAMEEYAGLFNELADVSPNLKMICHGYDHAFPRQQGEWIGPVLANKNIPKEMWHPIVSEMIDRFNEKLKTMITQFPGNAYHVDCRGAVGDFPEWRDELHSKRPGCGRVADRFRSVIGNATS